jgi:TRAP-type C4-dicarboxylate transport system permease small subunit
MTMHVVNQQVAMLNVSVSWFYIAIPIGAALAVPGVLLALADAERTHREGEEPESHLDSEDTGS